MARTKITATANTVRSMVAKYKNGAGLVALAKEFDLSVPVIRRILADTGVEIRGRGRPVATA